MATPNCTIHQRKKLEKIPKGLPIMIGSEENFDF